MKISYYYCFNCKKKFYLPYQKEKNLNEQYAYKLWWCKPFLFFVVVCPYCKKWQNVCGIKRKFITISLILGLVIISHIMLLIENIFLADGFFKIGNFLFRKYEIGLLLFPVAAIFCIFLPTILFYKD